MDRNYIFWRFANWYGWLLGFPFLAPLHRLMLNLSLHGLGYDNPRHSGEEWFVKNILANVNPTICIDIGANVGAYSKMLAEITKASVYAIEPAAGSYIELQKTAAQYPKHIHTHQSAISDHDGIATLYSRDALSEKATLNLYGNEKAQREEVRTMTVDLLVKELGLSHVDFIKIDTEGHERQVLASMKETLQVFKPAYIQFEFNHVHLFAGTTLYDLAELLPGYKLYRLLPHGWLPINPKQMSSNIYMFSNIIACRK